MHTKDRRTKLVTRDLDEAVWAVWLGEVDLEAVLGEGAKTPHAEEVLLMVPPARDVDASP
jgi:hypothetical protein